MLKHAKLITLIFSMLFVLNLSGCTDDGASATGGNNQHVQLDVENGSTQDGAIDASLTPLLVVKFDQKIDPHTINNNAITMQDSSGNSVKLDGVISNDENTSFYASPTSELKPHTTYKVAVSSSVQAEGTHEPMGHAFTLTTGESAIPEVGMISPENNATKVPQSPIIFFKFSSNVQNVNSSTVILHRDSPTGAVVPLEDIVAGANNTYAVTPKVNLGSSVNYYTEFTSGITNDSGVALESAVYKFKMIDMSPPIVTQLYPSDGELGVSTTPTISIKFHERAYGMDSTNVELHKGSESGAIQPITDIEEGAGALYTFSPIESLDENTKYFLVLKPGICDIVGNCIVRKVTTFTTGDFSIPEASLITPADNAEKVSRTPIIKVKFSEPVVNVNSNNIELRLGNELGAKVAIESITPGADNTYTFKPVGQLNEKTKYAVVLNSGIEDLGKHSLEKTVFTFTTGDFTAPEVSLLEPLNNSIGISRTPIISLSFSEAVVNVNANNLKLYAGSESGDLVPLSNITDENNVYSFTAKSALPVGVKYILVVESGIEDLEGNHLVRQVFSFTTSSSTAPTVSMVSPVNNATQVPQNTSIQVKFSESVLNVTTSTLELRSVSESGTKIATSAITQSANNTYTFSPNVALSNNVKYFVVATDSITNLTGAKLARTVFSFTAGDTIKPVATMLTTSDVSPDLNTYFQIQFSEPIKNLTESTVIITATTEAGAKVQINQISPDYANNRYAIYLNNAAGKTKYYVTLTNGIEDNMGNKLDKTVFTFNTAGSTRHAFFLTRDKKYSRCVYTDGVMSDCTSNNNFDVTILNPVSYASLSVSTVLSGSRKQYMYILTGASSATTPTSNPAIYKCEAGLGPNAFFGSCVAQTATNGYEARSGFISPDSKFLYFSNPTVGIVKCSITTGTGELTNCSQTSGGMPITSSDFLTSITYNKLSNSIYASLNSYGKIYNCPLNTDGSVTSCTFLRNTPFIGNHRGIEFNYDNSMMYAYAPGSNSSTIERCSFTNPNTFSDCDYVQTQVSGEIQSYGVEFIDDKVMYTASSSSTAKVALCNVNQSSTVSLRGKFENCSYIPNVTGSSQQTITQGFTSITFWRYY